MKYLSADELDVKIVSVDGDMCVVDAGLPFMLRIPRQSLSDEPHPGRYIGFGFEPEHVGRSALERTQARIAALIRHIADGGLFNVTMKGRDGEMAELSDPAWPEFSFQTDLDMLSAGGRLTLESGRVLTMMSALDHDKIDPSYVVAGFRFLLKMQSAPKLVCNWRYEAIVVETCDDYLKLEVSRVTGTLPVNALFYNHRYENRPKKGDILTVLCVSTDNEKVIQFVECLSETEEHEYVKRNHPGDVVKVIINEFSMTEGLFVDLDWRTHVKVDTPKGLNVRTYMECGVWSEGARVKAEIIENSKKNFKIRILKPKDSEDVFGLPVGTVVDAWVTPSEVRFRYNDRDYRLFGAEDYINESLADICPDGYLPVKAIVGEKGEDDNLRGPNMKVNPLWLIDNYTGDDGIFEASLHKYVPETKSFVCESHGLWFFIFDNAFGSFPPTYRPSVGSKFRIRHMPDADKPFMPVYDREETEYILPSGIYQGKVVDSYLNGRYVVETPAGLVTATVDATYPKYIVRYFVDTLGDVVVTVGDDGSAILTVDGIEFDCPLTAGAINVEPICHRGYGVLVRYQGIYGYLPAQTIGKDECDHSDIDDFVAKHSGHTLCAYMIPSVFGEHGTYFSLYNPICDPYMRVRLEVGQEVVVRVVCVTNQGDLKVTVNDVGISGIVMKKDAGPLTTALGVPARYEGEEFKAEIIKFVPVLHVLQLRAKDLSEPSIRKQRFSRKSYYDVEVAGYIGNEVIVRGKGFVGSLYGESNQVERLTVNRQLYNVGKKFKAMLMHVDKTSLVFSVSRDIVNRIDSKELKVGMCHKATVLCYHESGVVFEISGIPALMTRAAALEKYEPGEDISHLYPVGHEMLVKIVYVDALEKGIYVVTPDSPSLSCKGTRLRGTVLSLSSEKRTYEIMLHKGGFLKEEIIVNMPVDYASWNSWMSDRLEDGKVYDFVVKGMDFRTHMPFISRRDTMPNHWADAKSDKLDDKVVEAIVVGFTKGQAIVAFGDVRQTLSFPLGAYLAGRPWSADKSVGPDDIHVGSKFKLRVRGVNRKTRSYMLWPYFGAQLREIGKGTVDARIEHVGPDGVWVSFDSPASGRSLAFVRTADLSHARIDSPVGFFHEGDCEQLALCRVQDFDGGMLMSRKALIAPAVPGAKAGTGYAKVKVRGVARDKALVFVDGVERLLSTKIFDRKPVKDGVYSLHRAKIR